MSVVPLPQPPTWKYFLFATPLYFCFMYASQRCPSSDVSSPHIWTPIGSGVHRKCSHRFTHQSLTLLVIHTQRFGSPPQMFTHHGIVDVVLRQLCTRDLRAHLAVAPLNSHSVVCQSTGPAFYAASFLRRCFKSTATRCCSSTMSSPL